MAMVRARRADTESLARAGAVVAGCTLVLTASFVGLVALLSAEAPGVSTRLPFYVLGMAVSFVGAIVLLEARHMDGEAIIAAAGVAAVATFVFTTLSGEGIVYVVENPGRLVASQLLFYFLAAGMIGTGLGYWAFRHWQELADARVGPRSVSFRR